MLSPYRLIYFGGTGMRKELKIQFLRLAVIFCGLFSLANAQAHRYWYPGWGWGFGAGVIGGAVIAAPYVRPYYAPYPPPPVVYQQPVIVQSPPPIAYSAPIDNTPKSSIWYFCESEKNFYPNVASCPEPWKPVHTDPSSAYTAPNPPPLTSPQ
jgi:hypothetical protein